MSDPTRFKITWSDGRYFVNIPNYNGGEVVDATIVDALVKVLQFYASEWQPNGEGDPETPGLSRSWVEPTDELQNDGGRKAREALAKVSSCPKK